MTSTNGIEKRNNAYVAYYTAQAGGALRHYEGAASMRGYGIGSWFLNIFRRAVPIIAPIAKAAATRFVTSTRRNLDEGRPLGEALKQSAMDAGADAVAEGVDVVKKKMQGGGRQRSTKKRAVTKKRAPPAHPQLKRGYAHPHAGHQSGAGNIRRKKPSKRRTNSTRRMSPNNF
jgi:hypothetical protein